MRLLAHNRESESLFYQEDKNAYYYAISWEAISVFTIKVTKKLNEILFLYKNTKAVNSSMKF